MNDNPFWKPLRGVLQSATRISVFLLVLATIAFPIAEGVLTEVWSSAADGAKAAPGWTLMVVVVLHAIVGIYLIVEEVRSKPAKVIAEAYELAERFPELEDELVRREAAYRITRQAVDQLGLVACVIGDESMDKLWKRGGFHEGVYPVLKPFIDHASVVFGVTSNCFTLEIYFHPGNVPEIGREEVGPCGLSQKFFFGHHVDRCAGVCLEAKCSPAKLGIGVDEPFVQHVDQNKQLFFENGKPKECVYFKRYAIHPIFEPCCKTDAIGVLVLTAFQDDEFADDVLDTLAFIATLVTSYRNDYIRCYEAYEESQRQRAAARATRKPVLPSTKALPATNEQLPNGISKPEVPPQPGTN